MNRALTISVCFVIKRMKREGESVLPKLLSLILLCKKLDNTLYDIVQCYVTYIMM